MRIEHQRYELIERYLNQQLSDTALAEFRLKMEQDASFADEVKEHQAIHELIVDRALLDLKAKMKAFDHKGSTGNNNLKIYSGLAITAAIILGIVIYTNIDRPVKKEINTKREKVEPGILKDTSRIKKDNNIRYPAKSGVPVLKGEDRNRVEQDTVASLVPLQRSVENNKVQLDNQAQPEIVMEIQPETTVKEAEGKVTVEECFLERSAIAVQTSSSCGLIPTGKFTIDEKSLIEGREPIEYSIDGVNYFRDNRFNDLFPGIYYLSIRDAKGCVWKNGKEIIIEEKDCRETEYSFSPAKGEVWEFPMEKSSNAVIHIYNKGGGLVYTAQIRDRSPSSWDGTSNGQELPMGSYSYVLYIDGKILNGYVTILR